jgi:hypothetical protein
MEAWRLGVDQLFKRTQSYSAGMSLLRIAFVLIVSDDSFLGNSHMGASCQMPASTCLQRLNRLAGPLLRSESSCGIKPQVCRIRADLATSLPVSVVDSWLYGCLIYEVYNGVFSRSEQLELPGSIPKNIIVAYRQLTTTTPQNRSDLNKFIDSSLLTGQFFDNEYIKTALFLENISMKDSQEKVTYFKCVSV